MNISPVSFRSTVGCSSPEFSTFISRPQVYSQKEEPVAATNINGTEKKKSPLKTILGIALGAAGITAGIALGAKYGVFNPKVDGNKYVEMAKSGLKLFGEKTIATTKQAVSFIQTKWGEIKNHIPKAEEIVDVAEEVAEEITEAAVGV